MPATGPMRAGADIGGGAGDGAGDADAAEQRRADVGDALRHQLAVGAVAAAGHAVGDHAESSDSMAPSSAKEIASGSTACTLSRLIAAAAGRAGLRDAAEARADGLDRQAEQRRRPSAPRRRPRSACPASAAAALQPDDEADGQQRERHRGRVGARQRAPEAGSFSSSSPGSGPAASGRADP
jgi:hypothetical protein